ncbi:WXG100 family type VII secretion target [Kribbella speibonae]|uniref:Uncharacterized protein n=1 Tax=Kribbella speibonae TaxID=1572660 RepID=A0A4R0IBA5_9ACTN|nr:hypothetical protein [Kribbella speibonae]TCC28087.1 hypothetical protein E0H58_09235 [Kribbella speibonae]TCC29649.1 hypothetical protein E0H92_42300 [Kribbella speibonae]
MAGVETELDRMVRTATEAARIGDALKAVMTTLDGAMSSLTPMDGEIKNTFWQGHNNHLDAVNKLCTKLHRMSDGITTSKVAYEAQDASSQSAFSGLGASGTTIDTTVL